MKKINIFLISVLLLLFTIPQKAQSKSIERELLEKYWYYRYRLKHQFLVVSPDNEVGTNIPGSIRHWYGDKMNWGDSEVPLGFYIAVLASEYRLLKDYGQDYSETLNELKWAMLAVDRIDYYAELYWGGNADLNGFFVRCDAKGCEINNPVHPGYSCTDCILKIRNNASSYRNTLLEDDGTNAPLLLFAATDWKSENCSKVEAPREESQDQCWHLLYGLSLVKKMMEGELQTFQNMVGETLTMEQYDVTGSDGLDIHWEGGVRIGDGTGPVMQISGGNVGIGIQDTKGFKLAVAGSILTEKVKVVDDALQWHDYVFEADYELTPINELKKYVEINKHLPDIPSASDVKANGIELGEMNALLLKKIEELYLYTIEQDKQIKALQEQNKVILEKIYH